MIVKDTFNLENNPTRTKLELVKDSHGYRFREFRRELTEGFFEGEWNTYINYSSFDADDCNTYTKGLAGNVEDIHSFADMLEDLADYLKHTDEYITEIEVTFKED